MCVESDRPELGMEREGPPLPWAPCSLGSGNNLTVTFTRPGSPQEGHFPFSEGTKLCLTAYCGKRCTWGVQQRLLETWESPWKKKSPMKMRWGDVAGAQPSLIPQPSHPVEPCFRPQVTSMALSLNGATIWRLLYHFKIWCQCFLGFQPKGPKCESRHR